MRWVFASATTTASLTLSKRRPIPRSCGRKAPNSLPGASASGVFALALIHSLLGRSSATQQRPLPSKWLLCLLFHSGSQWCNATGLLHPWYPSTCCFLRCAKMGETLSSCGSCFWYYRATSAPSSLRAELFVTPLLFDSPATSLNRRPLGFAPPPHDGFALLANAHGCACSQAHTPCLL